MTDTFRTISKVDLRVVHLFPYSARLSGGHSNAIIAFLKSQIMHGLDARGLSPFSRDLPAKADRGLGQLPIGEMDFDAPDFCPRAMESAAGCPDTVFHFAGITPQFSKLARSLRQAAIPYVFTSHGQLHFRGPIHWLKKFIYLNVASPFVRNAGGLHFLTLRERSRLKRLLPFWRGAVLTQHNVVEVPDPNTVAPASREQQGIPAQAFVFAFLGRLDVQVKGLDLLVKAFASIPADDSCYLVLIGPDWAGGRQCIERLAKRLNCEERIRFLGPQFGDDKWRVLRMADAFVSPSRWEGFGIAQAEAIGFGVPTIVSTGMNLAPEVVKHGAAIASPLSSTDLAREMEKVMGNDQLRRALGNKGRDWVLEHCSPQTAGASFADFYLRVLQGR